MDPVGLTAFTAYCLIPLNNNPGVRPIVIGEVSRRLIAKAVLYMVRNDVLQAASPMQLCAGQPSGCEAAIHAMKAVFDSPDAKAVLQVYATNVFSCLNRQMALRNISANCPSFAQILTKAYHVNSLL